MNNFIVYVNQLKQYLENISKNIEDFDENIYIKYVHDIIVAGVYNKVNKIQLLKPNEVDLLLKILKGYIAFDKDDVDNINKYISDIFELLIYVRELSTEDASAIVQVLL